MINFIVIDMNYMVMQKLNENPLGIKYLRENSHYYKILNRNPELIDQMLEEMKTKYGMRKMDKVSNIMDSVSLVSKIWKATKE